MTTNYDNATQNISYVVSTLGRFDIKKNGFSLSETSGSSKKIWELYKFMLTFRDRSFTPESLMDQLWVSEEYSDPRATLRIQMHRLRQCLGESETNEADRTLLFANGYYKWNGRLDLTIDIDIFEKKIKLADSLIKISPDEALEVYKEALELYTGDYLPECVDQHWIFPIRNHYRRLFLNASVRTIELMHNNGSYSDIIMLCQKGISIDVYEEIFHLHLMEAMLFQGNQRKALEHYGYITTFYEREMGIKPSDEMRSLYKKMLQSHQSIRSEESLHKALDMDAEIENAFFCEPDVFKSICELERRRNQRTGANFCVGVISVNHKKGYTFAQKELQMTKLKQHFLTQLRKGDTLTRWNEDQLVVLMSGIDAELTEKVLNRVLGGNAEFATVSVEQISGLEKTYKRLEDLS